MSNSPLRSVYFQIAVMVIVSICAGSIAGWSAAKLALSPEVQRLEQGIRDQLSSIKTTSTNQIPPTPVVTYQPKSLANALPPSLITSRQSAVLTLVRRGLGKTPEERIVTPDRTVGHAVSVTSDGWLVTSFSALNGLHAADLSVMWRGQTYPITKAIRDQATDVVFLKISATDLPVTAFVRAEDVQAGTIVWAEGEPRRLEPETVTDVRLSPTATPLSSERATRRFRVTGSSTPAWVGSAVWDERGLLVGLFDARQSDGWTVIPAGNIRSALSMVLTGQTITHATLGIQSTDLAATSFDETRGTLPSQGAWIRLTPTGTTAKLLQTGDIIENLERDILDGGADLGELLLSYSPGTTVTISGEREGKSIQISVKLGGAGMGETLK